MLMFSCKLPETQMEESSQRTWQAVFDDDVDDADAAALIG